MDLHSHKTIPSQEKQPISMAGIGDPESSQSVSGKKSELVYTMIQKLKIYVSFIQKSQKQEPKLEAQSKQISCISTLMPTTTSPSLSQKNQITKPYTKHSN